MRLTQQVSTTVYFDNESGTQMTLPMTQHQVTLLLQMYMLHFKLYNNKIASVKLFRQETGVSLLEAKLFIEEAIRQVGEEF